jgi:hypothetical protein
MFLLVVFRMYLQYAMIVVMDVHPSQVAQWVTVLAVRCLEPRKMRMKMYLAVICSQSVIALEDLPQNRSSAYMKIQGHGHNKSRDCKTIANFLHQNTSRSECRRSNVVATVVVHDDADGKVDTSRNTTAKCESLRVFSRVCHLRDDGEVGRHAAESEDDRGNCSHSFRKCRLTEEPVRRDVRTVLRRGCRAILNADSNSKREDYIHC